MGFFLFFSMNPITDSKLALAMIRPGVSYTDIIFESITFLDITWTMNLFKGVIFKEVTFLRCRFTENIFEHARFINCTFDHCEMTKMTFQKCIFDTSTFKTTTITSSHIIHSRWNHSRITAESSLAHIAIHHTIFKYQEWTDCEIIHSSFQNCEIEYSTFQQTSFHNTDFKQITFYRTPCLQFQYLNHTATYFQSSRQLIIGCLTYPIEEWLENYQTIGKNHHYSDSEIEAYHQFMRICDSTPSP